MKKKYSGFSIAFITFGLLMLGINYMSTNFNEVVVLVGYMSLIFGAILSFVAISKKENGNMKYISVASCFIVLGLVTYFEPFQIIRMLTWIKN